MKVVILAGGLGTRLGTEGELMPKPLVRIGDKPILWHIMKVYSYYGLNDFVICLGYKGEMIKEYFYSYDILNSDFTIDFKTSKIKTHSKHSEKNWKVTLVDTGEDALKGARIKKIEKYLNSDINMLTYSDGVGDVNIRELLKYHQKHNKIITITGVHLSSRFGEIKERQGRVVTFTEKPKFGKEIKNGGFMIFSKRIMAYLSEEDNSDFEVGPLEKLARKGEVMVYKHPGNWECMDTARDVTYLNKLWREKKAFWKLWK